MGAIAAARKMTPEEVRALIDDGPFLATAGASPDGLVDGLLYRDQVEKELKDKLKAAQRSIGFPPATTCDRQARPADARTRGRIWWWLRATFRGGPRPTCSETSRSFARTRMRRQLRLIADDATIKE